MASLAHRLLVAFVGCALAFTASHGARAAGPTVEVKAPAATLTLANRALVTFRATILGNTPAVRVERATDRLDALTDAEYANPVKAFPASLGELRGMQVLVGDKVMFSVLPDDVDPEERLTVEQAAERARANLEAALKAKRDQRSVPVILAGLAHAAVVTLVLALALWAVRRAGRTLVGWLARRSDALSAAGGRGQWWSYALRLFTHLLHLFGWLLVAVLCYGWLTYVLDHFPMTEPLGQNLVHFVTTLVGWLATGAVASIPGIVTVAVVLFVTRAIVEVLDQIFRSVQTGRAQLPLLHPETVPATRRIVTLIAWTIALAVAYPFIPGSSTDAFKGLSVLIGVMISLGSTGLVTQMMSGLVIVYSRALRKGDLVVVNDIEGMVSEVGTLATKLVTMRSEEITIPNSVVVASPIRNYSKLAGTHGTLVSTKVTIGYDAPWRQVHAMLLMAAGRTPGLRADPPPYVYQRALGDFYVEYELFAHVDNPLARVAILSELHANIQDTFNEHGVQILSPHFVLQPHEPVVVPPDKWYAAPARAPEAPKG